jgi:hypothetical protein
MIADSSSPSSSFIFLPLTQRGSWGSFSFIRVLMIISKSIAYKLCFEIFPERSRVFHTDDAYEKIGF